MKKVIFLMFALLSLALVFSGAAQEKSDEFEKVVAPGGKAVRLASGIKFAEGPVWLKEDESLVFSDIPANEQIKWKDGKAETFRKPSNNTNGAAVDGEGRFVCCEHGSRSVIRLSKDGKSEILADSYQAKKLNSPNDVAVKSDGTIWFTDPPYGLGKREREQTSNNVYRLNPANSELQIVADDFDKPNGICFSPDEKKLYVADSGKPTHIRVFDVLPDGTLANGKVFCKIDSGVPDGIKCDREGRLFSSAGDGVHVFSAGGALLGKIPVPEAVANLCFGGKDGKTLFMTARTSLYSITLKAAGAGF